MSQTPTKSRKEYQRQWRLLNPERCKSYAINALNWRRKNPDMVKVINKKYANNNIEKVKKIKRNWWHNNQDKIIEYRAKNRERLAAYHRAWRARKKLSLK